MDTTGSINAKNVGRSTGLFASGITGRAGKMLAAGALAVGAAMTLGVGTASAESVQTEGSYPSRAACQAAGPGVMASTPGSWDNFWCVPDPAVTGSWRLMISSGN